MSRSASSEPVVIVNETMARRLWPGRDPLGRKVIFPASVPALRTRTVIGVARDSKYINIYENALPYVYIAMAQDPSSMRSVYVRAAGRPEDLMPRVQQAVHELDPEMPVADLRTMKQTMEGSLGYVVFRLSAVQAVGMLLGLLVAAGTTMAMSKVFFLVNTTDLATFATVTCFLTAVVLAACYQPARRATRVDPVVALRQD